MVTVAAGVGKYFVSACDELGVRNGKIRNSKPDKPYEEHEKNCTIKKHGKFPVEALSNHTQTLKLKSLPSDVSLLNNGYFSLVDAQAALLIPVLKLVIPYDSCFAKN